MPCATVRCPTYTVRHLETLVHLSTRLDCDLVAVEQDDELTLLVELNAPAPSTRPASPPPCRSSWTAAAPWAVGV